MGMHHVMRVPGAAFSDDRRLQQFSVPIRALPKRLLCHALHRVLSWRKFSLLVADGAFEYFFRLESFIGRYR